MILYTYMYYKSYPATLNDPHISKASSDCSTSHWSNKKVDIWCGHYVKHFHMKECESETLFSPFYHKSLEQVTLQWPWEQQTHTNETKQAKKITNLSKANMTQKKVTSGKTIDGGRELVLACESGLSSGIEVANHSAQSRRYSLRHSLRFRLWILIVVLVLVLVLDIDTSALVVSGIANVVVVVVVVVWGFLHLIFVCRKWGLWSEPQILKLEFEY